MTYSVWRQVVFANVFAIFPRRRRAGWLLVVAKCVADKGLGSRLPKRNFAELADARRIFYGPLDRPPTISWPCQYC